MWKTKEMSQQDAALTGVLLTFTFDLEFSRSNCILEMGGPIVMERKGRVSIGCPDVKYNHFVTSRLRILLGTRVTMSAFPSPCLVVIWFVIGSKPSAVTIQACYCHLQGPLRSLTKWHEQPLQSGLFIWNFLFGLATFCMGLPEIPMLRAPDPGPEMCTDSPVGTSQFRDDIWYELISITCCIPDLLVVVHLVGPQALKVTFLVITVT